ncbi:MAG: zf-HC2 domain-containing protein [Gemmatimonadetes bacterium]|nr:zf-HC2 domain-containing protein [Gemmatimonadota bacterium]
MSEPPMLSCKEAVEQLWAYIDGELPASEADRVHDHLHACGACSPQHDYQRAFREFLRAQARERIPPDLRRRIFLRLLAEERGNP